MIKRSVLVLFSLAFFMLLLGCVGGNGESDGDAASKDNNSSSESSDSGDAEYEFQVANVLAESDVSSYGLDKFEELVEEKSDGNIQIEVLHGGQLGSGVETFEAVKNGNLDFAADSFANLASITPAFEMFHLPFLFESRDQLLNAFNSDVIKEQINGELESDSLKWFTTFEIGGPRVIGTSDTKVTSLDDLEGMTFRASRSPLEIASQEAWGAKGQTVDWPETPESVRLGMVDGLTVPYASFHSAQFHEGDLINYIADVSFQNYASVTAVNTEMWAELPDDVKTILEESQQEAREWHIDFVGDYVTENINEMKDAGVEIYSVSDENYEEIKEATKDTVWDEFIGNEGMSQEKLDLIQEEIGPVGDGGWGYDISE
ncbi:TRAP-type C4-dicarboxylate transport system, substrate-binding protein [Lentibacillus persicus]|uniref:TRAP-type C4-dicarboxylate transport system, substrate-binding protein n=1 Tax=Lentibacillus persicus TaxID=640948 RepID=A0A1I1W3T6_9BACI|nr:TRAP transporter substrate-binding protein [Lentibacillus persicus]SFD87630.1 TRAP-type C4-dicarboxylate transport system, substrate-binding protein [Lentibacillus persicus]